MRWVACLAMLVTAAWGDGCIASRPPVATTTVPVSLTEDRQRAAIVFAAGKEQLVLGVSAAGRAREAAWLVPVPATLTRGDVDLVPASALDALFEGCAPRRTRVVEPPKRVWHDGPLSLLAPPICFIDDFAELNLLTNLGKDTFATAGQSRPGSELTEAVTLHDAFERGPYHLDLLSATNGTELVAWLRQGGYEVPDRLGELAEEYLHAGLRFVAMRLSGAGDGPVASELPPLSLTFAATQPWFPLRISQAGAPEMALIQIVVAAELPVRCVGAPEQSLQATVAGRHDSLGEQRRRAAGALSHAGLVREAVWPLDVATFRGADPIRVGYGSNCLTRYWGLFTREAMADLRFELLSPAAAGKAWRAEESGHGSVRLPWWLGLLGSPWWPLLLALAIGGLGYRQTTVAPAADTPARHAVLHYAAAASVVMILVLATLLGLVEVGGSLRKLADALAGPVLVPLLLLLPITLAGIVLPAAVWSLSEQMGQSRATRIELLVATGLAIGVGALAIRDDTAPNAVLTAHSILLLACWTALVSATLAEAGRLWARRPDRRQLPYRVLTGLLCGYLAAGVLGLFYNNGRALYRQRAPMDVRAPLLEAVRQFRHDHGAWPRQLSDLAATSLPATGLDTAGNVVPLPATPWHRYLDELPPEPISGGRQPWRYDPSDELVVDAQWRFGE